MSAADSAPKEEWFAKIISVKDLPDDIINAIKDKLVEVAVEAISTVAGAVGALIWAVSDKLVGFVVDFMTAVSNKMVDLANDIVPKMVDTMNTLVDRLSSNINAFGDALKSGFLSTFGWSVDEIEKSLKDVARTVIPWYQVGEVRFADASAKALVTYWLLSRFENIVSGRGGLFRTFFDILTFPFYLKLVSGVVPVVSEVVRGISVAPPVRTFTAPSPPPIAEYESDVPEAERLELGHRVARENRYVGSVGALRAYLFGGWQS